ncbi:hypothetical protein EV360DRAFT_80867 [Lentinula raphanica]|nr:hypothetical protein EV360DRAFT_80867 [Lentinula raphanica]
MSLPPPSYESSDAVIPDYSIEPRADEQRLQYQQTRPLQGFDRPTGVFVQQKDGITVVLNHQENKTQTPIVEQNSNIEGTLIIDAPESASEVALKLTGNIEAVSPATGWISVNVLDQTHTLFRNSSDGTTSQSNCPSSLPFSCPLPHTFNYSGREYQLPPSYYVLMGGQGQAYYAKCTYNFSAVVIKERSRRTASFLGKNKKHSNNFVIEYMPRSRPPRPLAEHPLSATTSERFPTSGSEEWRQFTYQLSTKSKKYASEPLTCQFFLPSVGIFGIRDSIPFHVQIIGSTDSLAKLQTVAAKNGKSIFRVHLLRQVTINNNGKQSAVHFPLGEAKISVAPLANSSGTTSSGQGQQGSSLSWEGAVCCDLSEEKIAPSFKAGIVSVMDTSVQDPSYKPSIHARAGPALEPAEADYTAELTLYTPESQDEDISEAFAAGIGNVMEVVLPSILPLVHVEHRNKVRVNLEKFLSFRVTQLTYCASPPHSDDDNLSRDHYMVDVKLKDKSNQPLDFLDHTLYFLKSVYDAQISEQFIAAYVVRLQGEGYIYYDGGLRTRS